VKNMIAKGLVTLMLASGLVAAATIPASAHTPSHTVDCTVLTVDLVKYAKKVPAQDAVPAIPGQDYIAPTFETQANPDYVEARTETIEHEAVFETEYKFVHKFYPFINKVKWSTNPNWNADDNENSLGWRSTDETRETEVEAAWTEIIEHEAIGDPTIEVMTDPGQEAIETVPGVDAIPAKANTIVVTIDGVIVEDTTFGKKFSADYPFANSYTAHDWSIVVTAWDDSKYDYNVSGTTTPCIPEQPADELVITEWVETGYECDSTVSNWARTVSTTPYIFIEGEWVEGETEVVDETQTRGLTKEELEANACPKVAEELPTVPVAKADTLPYTGGGDIVGAWWLALLPIGGALMLAARKFARA